MMQEFIPIKAGGHGSVWLARIQNTSEFKLFDKGFEKGSVCAKNDFEAGLIKFISSFSPLPVVMLAAFLTGSKTAFARTESVNLWDTAVDLTYNELLCAVEGLREKINEKKINKGREPVFQIVKEPHYHVLLGGHSQKSVTLEDQTLALTTKLAEVKGISTFATKKFQAKKKDYPTIISVHQHNFHFRCGSREKIGICSITSPLVIKPYGSKRKTITSAEVETYFISEAQEKSLQLTKTLPEVMAVLQGEH